MQMLLMQLRHKLPHMRWKISDDGSGATVQNDNYVAFAQYIVLHLERHTVWQPPLLRMVMTSSKMAVFIVTFFVATVLPEINILLYDDHLLCAYVVVGKAIYSLVKIGAGMFGEGF